MFRLPSRARLRGAGFDRRKGGTFIATLVDYPAQSMADPLQPLARRSFRDLVADREQDLVACLLKPTLLNLIGYMNFLLKRASILRRCC